MNFIDGITKLSEQHSPCVATIGNFDGVHLGHQHVIQSLLSFAHAAQLPSTVITFEPLAREFFAPDTMARLTSLEQRVDELRKLGVEQVLKIQFSAELAAMTADAFVKQVLVDGLGVKYLTVGDDFKFGRNRSGDFAFLQSQGEQLGFQVESHDTFMIDGQRVSSGRIREAVADADFALANKLLGRPYSLVGRVVAGEQRGRTIGFPTANIVLDRINYAVHGVYAVRVHRDDQSSNIGVANVGCRPTVDGVENRLETHLFDFADDLYGAQIEVEFCSKIRDEKKFDSFEELQKQIQQDASAARKYFNN